MRHCLHTLTAIRRHCPLKVSGFFEGADTDNRLYRFDRLYLDKCSADNFVLISPIGVFYFLLFIMSLLYIMSLASEKHVYEYIPCSDLQVTRKEDVAHNSQFIVSLLHKENLSYANLTENRLLLLSSQLLRKCTKRTT